MKNNHRHNAEVIIERFLVVTHQYLICKDEEGMYWGIDYKLIDDSEAEINGINGNMSDTLNATLQKCWLDAMIDFEKIDVAKAFFQHDEAEQARMMALMEECEELFPV